MPSRRGQKQDGARRIRRPGGQVRAGLQPPAGLRALFCLVLILAWPGYGLAGDVSVDMSAGYNSNPTEARTGEGSGFSEFSASLFQEVSPSEGWNLDLMPRATYQNFWERSDNYSLGADVLLVPKVPWGHVLPGLFAKGYLYRDNLVEADERNEFALGTRVDWFVSARSSLSLEASWRNVGYLSESAPFSGNRPGQGFGSQGGVVKSSGTKAMAGSGQALADPAPARDDRDLRCTAAVEPFLLPNLSGTLSLDYGDLDSSLDMESYRQLTPSVNVVWLFMENWQLAMDVAMEYRDYHELEAVLETAGEADSVKVREKNKTGTMIVEIRRYFDSLEVFARYGVARGEYPLNDESYTQQIVQCGISLSY